MYLTDNGSCYIRLELFVSSFAQYGLQSLLMCADDKVVHVLRHALRDLQIGVEHCTDLDSAVQKLSHQRFEGVIVDCTSQEIAAKILKGTHSSPSNKRAITVAIIDGQSALKNAFELGAHFVLFKPISVQRTKSSFRAVRALMKRERRRDARIAVELPIELHLGKPARIVKCITADLSENGVAIRHKVKLPQSFRVRFVLPGTAAEMNCTAEVAWENTQLQGLRFRDLSDEGTKQLKSWIARQLLETDADDPPVSCRLTDLSLSACYLETESPFPVRTRLQITMKVRELEVQIEGIVRIMHPGTGIGAQFTPQTPQEKKRVEDFIQALVNTEGAIPEIEVGPDSIDNGSAAFFAQHTESDHDDSLLSLLRTGVELPQEEFRAELRRQRRSPGEVG
jgi:DNA-binding response OmpR family regulator